MQIGYLRFAQIAGARMVQDSGEEWLTVSEAARRFGLTRQAIQYKIKKGLVEHRLDNRGNPMVLFAASPQGALPGAKAASVCASEFAPLHTPEPSGPRQGTSEMVPLSMHREVVEALQASYSSAMQQVEQLRANMAAQQARADAEVERLVGQFHAERSFWTERADAAEIRAEQSAAALNDLVGKILTLVPTPAPVTWFERWFGSSRRSRLRSES